MAALLLAACPLCGVLADGAAVSGAGRPPAAPAAAPAPRPSGSPALPQTPGFHNLFYTGRLLGQQRKLAYVLYLPKGYDPNRPRPLLLYLCGVGERGNNHEGVYWNGPPLSLKADKALAEWAPFIVLAPQCPPDLRWDSPGFPWFVMDLLDMAKDSWAVDGDRVYLTGLSMGGAGVWSLALEGRGAFAVVAPFCAPEVAAARMPRAIRGSTVLIVCGGADGGYTQGSRKMHKTLQDAGADVLYVEVPGQGHGVWPPFYASRQFYEFLLMHARGRKTSTTRPVTEQLLAISYRPPNSADAQLAEPFRKFLPWWFLTNCGRENSPGLKDELLGRKNVFVTTPLDKAVACRLLFTTAIPAGKRTALDLTVAAHPQGQWELGVRANGEDIFRRTIGEGEPAGGLPPKPPPRTSSQPASQGAAQPTSRPSPWVELSVDLSDFAGREVHLEVLNRSTGSRRPEAYWGKVGLRSDEPADR